MQQAHSIDWRVVFAGCLYFTQITVENANCNCRLLT